MTMREQLDLKKSDILRQPDISERPLSSGFFSLKVEHVNAIYIRIPTQKLIQKSKK